MDVYLNKVSVFQDEQHLIEDLDFVDESNIDFYKKELKYHYKTSKSAPEIAYNLMLKLFEECPISKDELEIVIFTSSQGNGGEQLNPTTMNSVLEYHGLKHTTPIYVSGVDCANSSVALSIAKGFVLSGQAKNVFIVSTSVFPNEDLCYKMEPKISIYSDAGIGLWLSSDKQNGGFVVKELTSKNSPSQASIDMVDEYQKYSANKMKLFRQLFKNDTVALNDRLDLLLMNNYFENIIKMYASIIKVDENKLHYSSLKEFGHAPAGDVFISLYHLFYKDERRTALTRIGLLTDSPNACYFVLLEKC